MRAGVCHMWLVCVQVCVQSAEVVFIAVAVLEVTEHKAIM